jgi:hypothetical protein
MIRVSCESLVDCALSARAVLNIIAITGVAAFVAKMARISVK